MRGKEGEAQGRSWRGVRVLSPIRGSEGSPEVRRWRGRGEARGWPAIKLDKPLLPLAATPSAVAWPTASDVTTPEWALISWRWQGDGGGSRLRYGGARPAE